MSTYHLCEFMKGTKGTNKIDMGPSQSLCTENWIILPKKCIPESKTFVEGTKLQKANWEDSEN